MTVGQSTWSISGRAGLLKAGFRTAATLNGWSAAVQPDGRWRISVDNHTPDPYWLENGSGFRGVLNVGRAEIKGPAEIVSLDPLIFDMEIGTT